jgi:hypothetical protein
MLNAHHDTDVNDNETEQSYKEDADKWKKRGTECKISVVRGREIITLIHCKTR